MANLIQPFRHINDDMLESRAFEQFQILTRQLEKWLVTCK